MSELQTRLKEAEDISIAETLGEGLSYNEQLCIRLRTKEARAKALKEEVDDLKKEVRELVTEGELVGSEEVGGYYTISESNRETFDWKEAAMSGLFTKEQAKPFMKNTAVESLRFAAIKQ